MRRPSVLFIGDRDEADFAPTWCILTKRAHVIAARTIDLATGVSCEPPPDLIIFAASRRGELSQAAIDQLRSQFPLAAAIHLVGAGGEGEVRSGVPLAGVYRLYWHQTTTLAAGFDDLDHGRSPIWSQPDTATEEDRILARRGRPLPSTGLVVIQSENRDLRELLVSAFTKRGFATVANGGNIQPMSATGAVLVIVDVAGLEIDRTDQFTAEMGRIRIATTGAPLIVLAGFPRIEHRDAMLEAGASAVLSKPFSMNDLFWEAARLTQTIAVQQHRHLC